MEELPDYGGIEFEDLVPILNKIVAQETGLKLGDCGDACWGRYWAGEYNNEVDLEGMAKEFLPRIFLAKEFIGDDDVIQNSEFVYFIKNTILDDEMIIKDEDIPH